MSFFSNLFKKTETKSEPVQPQQPLNSTPKTKRVYVAGWEVHLNGDEQCEDFLNTMATDKKTVKTINVGLELIFEDDKLEQTLEYDNGKAGHRTLKSGEAGLPYKVYKENTILALDDEMGEGYHQLGGELPEGFSLPENNCVVPFQYLGFISKDDPQFSWLPSTIHLTAPIFLNFDMCFLDYSDPNKPVLINRDDVEGADTSYDDDLNKDSEIVYEAWPFNFVPAFGFPGNGHAGIPNYIQYPVIPHCPKSGKRMRFLCQLNGGVKTMRSNVVAKHKSYEEYYNKLNFWGDGDLFVFVEPESKVVGYFIQNT